MFLFVRLCNVYLLLSVSLNGVYYQYLCLVCLPLSLPISGVESSITPPYYWLFFFFFGLPLIFLSSSLYSSPHLFVPHSGYYKWRFSLTTNFVCYDSQIFFFFKYFTLEPRERPLYDVVKTRPNDGNQMTAISSALNGFLIFYLLAFLTSLVASSVYRVEYPVLTTRSCGQVLCTV